MRCTIAPIPQHALTCPPGKKRTGDHKREDVSCQRAAPKPPQSGVAILVYKGCTDPLGWDGGRQTLVPLAALYHSQQWRDETCTRENSLERKTSRNQRGWGATDGGEAEEGKEHTTTTPAAVS